MYNPQCDEYGTVINSEATFHWIVERLIDRGACFFPWTDQAGTQFDILLTWKNQGVSYISPHLFQRGIKPWDLFVSIMSKTAFGFDLIDFDTSEAYYAEKLNLPVCETTKQLKELFNGVKLSLVEKTKVWTTP